MSAIFTLRCEEVLTMIEKDAELVAAFRANGANIDVSIAKTIANYACCCLGTVWPVVL